MADDRAAATLPKYRAKNAARRIRRMSVVLALALLSASHGASGAPPGYGLGHGLDLGPLNVAGYSNIEADAPRGMPSEISADLSLFLSGHFNRYVNPFSETEIDQLPLLRQPGASGSASLAVERLYDDVYLGASTTLRLGKMLTPAGEWNLVHAAPLVWTVTRPLATYYSFPVSVTGASLNLRESYRGYWDLHAYVQPNVDAWWKSGDHAPRPYSRVAGIDVRYAWDVLARYRLGIAWQRADLPLGGGTQEFASVYGGFSTGQVRWTFQGDMAHIRGSTLACPHTREGGGYLQAGYPVAKRWYIVAQGERYQARDYQKPALRRLAGLVYRPHPAIAWKLDLVDATGAPIGSPSGIYAAWAVLF